MNNKSKSSKNIEEETINTTVCVDLVINDETETSVASIYFTSLPLRGVLVSMWKFPGFNYNPPKFHLNFMVPPYPPPRLPLFPSFQGLSSVSGSRFAILLLDLETTSDNISKLLKTHCFVTFTIAKSVYCVQTALSCLFLLSFFTLFCKVLL